MVVVPNHGLGAWLRQYLAERDGVAAGLDMPLPGSFVWQVLRQIDGELPRESPYSRTVLTWRAWRWLASHPPERFRDYLAAAPRIAAERRFDLARQIADVLDRYLVYRPDLLVDWERDPPATGDAAWQAKLWRHIVAATGVPHPGACIADLTRRLENDPGLAGDLAPVAVFAVAHLPPATLTLLAALGAAVDVELFVLAPCRQYWADIVEPSIAARARVTGGPGAAEYYTTGNPLLGSMGRLGREFIDLAIDLTSRHPEGVADEVFEAPAGHTLLAHTQREMLDLTVRGVAERPGQEELASNAGKFAVQPDDDSISVHVCASLVREIEVLHDQLLARFAADPSLEPRDIVVLAPDVAKLTPIVEAVFGSRDGARFIPYAIGDRAPRVEGAVADVFRAFLGLPESRMTRTAVLSLLNAPVVAGKYGLGADDLALISHWVEQAGVYWGLDAEHVRRLDVEPEQPPARGLGTWGTGIDRVMAGYAMVPGEVMDAGGAGILPLPGVEGRAAVVAGILAEFVDELARTAAALAEPAGPRDWRARLEALLRGFFDAEGESAVAVSRVAEAIVGFERDLIAAGVDEALPPAVVQRWFDARLEDASIGQGLVGGAVTFAPLAAMRAVPFRVVALVGMNDTDYPRVERPITFDLMAGSRRKGDPSRRNEDRYLFIEALLSARDALHVSYTGMAQRDATPMLPSVVISELLDYLGMAACLAGDAGRPAAEASPRLLGHVVRAQPLQPFSARYGRDPGLFTFEHYEKPSGATARRSAGNHRGAAGGAPELPLIDLVRFASNPAQAWFEAALAARLTVDVQHWQDDEPFELDGLDRWRVRNRALEALAWMDGDAWIAQAAVDGSLPHGARGRELIRQVHEDMSAMRARIVKRAGGPVTAEPVRLHIAGVVVAGTIPDLGPKGRVVGRVGKAGPRDLARLWSMHLVLAAAGRPLDSWLVDDRVDCRLVAPAVAEARRHLAALVEYARRNAERPVPLLCATGMHHAAPRETAARVGVENNLDRALEGDFRDEHTRRVWGEPHVPEGLDTLARQLYAPLFGFLDVHD